MVSLRKLRRRRLASPKALQPAGPAISRGRIRVVTSPTVVASLVPVIAHAVAVFGDEQKATR